MTSYCPDVNVWLALTYQHHVHHQKAVHWLASVAHESRVIFTRFTQLGLLRLVTNQAVLGMETVTLGRAWDIYDRWLEDPRVEFYPEPEGMERSFREATEPHFHLPASKVVGDCYLLACAKQSDATLVTFDRALGEFARKNGCPAVIPVKP